MYNFVEKVYDEAKYVHVNPNTFLIKFISGLFFGSFRCFSTLLSSFRAVYTYVSTWGKSIKLDLNVLFYGRFYWV